MCELHTESSHLISGGNERINVNMYLAVEEEEGKENYLQLFKRNVITKQESSSREFQLLSSPLKLHSAARMLLHG